MAGPSLPRRRFLALAGAGVAGAALFGVSLPGGHEEQPLAEARWLFGRFVPHCTETAFDERGLTEVSLPHCVTPLSWDGWQPGSWEARWVYRWHFDSTQALRAARAFVSFDGVLTNAAVFLNGRLLGNHDGGYLPFDLELTGRLAAHNVLAVVVDGRWQLDVPPDLPGLPGPNAIDFYQPAGVYRAVSVHAAPLYTVTDVYARPVDVLTPRRRLDVRCVLDCARPLDAALITVDLLDGGHVLASASVPTNGLTLGSNEVACTLTGLAAARLWDVTDPRLYQVRVTFMTDGRAVDRHTVRIGFREAAFTPDGFFLNGRRLKLFGLNRHQWYPFAGGAMPDRVQRRDAQILRHELNCTMVRCSHYPQSPAFLDACDELGLLVWEEIPGWDHVGDAVWQRGALSDVRDMVTRDRNHPSIVVWGTRINETLGQAELYQRTDQLARQLDPSRPTGGAVTGLDGYRTVVAPSSDGSSVFAFNDYSARPRHPFRLRPPRAGLPYLVTEAVGTLTGQRYCRRTDPVAVQSEQALLHAAAHDQAASDDRYSGLLGWCAFDYPSGWYHSAHGLKSPGVADIFRIPKLGAGFYQSQVDPSVRPVIEPGFYWDFGPGSPVGGPGRGALIWSNCEELVLYLDGRRFSTATQDRSAFPHLRHPPFSADLTVPLGATPQLRVDGLVGGKVVLRRTFSADARTDVLSAKADDAELVADGSDATRVVLRAVDRFGAQRPFVSGVVSFDLSGPAVLVGDNPLDLGATGGAAAVWLRTVRGSPGEILLYAVHPTLGAALARVTSKPPTGG